MSLHALRRIGTTLGLGAGTALLLAAPVSAHLDAEPSSVPAGTATTIAFTVEHGCGDSPTVKLEVQLPEGASGATAKPVGAFTGAVVDGVATWTGGSLPSEETGEFPLEVTLAGPAGDVAFNTIQTCETGELKWIEPTEAGQPEPEHPAPVVEVTGEAPATTEATTTTTEATTSTTEATTSTTEVAVAPTASDDDGGDSKAPLVIAGVAAVVVIGVGGYALSRSQKSKSAE